jgi:hypothetical protein
MELGGRFADSFSALQRIHVRADESIGGYPCPSDEQLVCPAKSSQHFAIQTSQDLFGQRLLLGARVPEE